MGRKYFLRADSHEQCEQILHQLTALVEIAKKRVDKRTLFEKSQAVVKALYDSPIYLDIVSVFLILVISDCSLQFRPEGPKRSHNNAPFPVPFSCAQSPAHSRTQSTRVSRQFSERRLPSQH